MRTCLVLDDSPESRRWLERALRASFAGIELKMAGTLKEAREILSRTKAPELALIDLGLPDGSGIELIAQLNRDSPATVCVVASIYDDDRHLFPALRAGAQGYLLKDQNWRELAQLLQGIVEGRPPLSPAIARKLLGYFHPVTPSPYPALTQREVDVLSLIAKGLTLSDSARMLGISPHTAAGYVKEIYRKLNVSSRAEAALTAQKLGIID